MERAGEPSRGKVGDCEDRGWSMGQGGPAFPGKCWHLTGLWRKYQDQPEERSSGGGGMQGGGGAGEEECPPPDPEIPRETFLTPPG